LCPFIDKNLARKCQNKKAASEETLHDGLTLSIWRSKFEMESVEKMGQEVQYEKGFF